MGRLWVIVALIGLTGCGGLYSSPQVTSGVAEVGNVRVVAIDASSLKTANAAPFRARALPSVFTRSAGLGGGAIGAGDMPDPAFTPQPRPTSLPTRLPPPYEPEGYRIGTGDVILLATATTGSSVETLSGLLAAQNSRQGYTVQDDGAISIPEVGRIHLAGRTLEEADAEVFDALVAKQIDPTFSIEIAEFNAQRISIGGAVRAAKTLPITLKTLRLSEAIAAAGGITVRDADFASIRLYRDAKLYRIPIRRYLEDTEIQTLALKDGDAIYVDTAFDLDKAEGYFAQQIELATFRQTTRDLALRQLETEVALRRGALNEERANFRARVDLDAVARDYVYIAGEVGLQNRFTLPFERKASLADALFDKTEGVPNRTGNVSELYVLRAGPDGRGVIAWHLNAVNAANLVLATRFELRPNDVVFVAEHPVTTLDRLVGQLVPSIALAGAL